MTKGAARNILFLAAAAAAVAVGVIAGELWFRPGRVATESASSGVAAIGGPFSLTDQDGSTRTDADFRGKLMLIYFGYAYCPDACPTALSAMTIAIDRLDAAGAQVAPIFITIDPARDTQALLKTYVSNFHPRLVALTGTPAEVAQAAKAYRVYYAKQKDESTTGGYLMDHSSIVYLMARDGRYLTHFTHAAKPDAMAAEIKKHLEPGTGS